MDEEKLINTVLELRSEVAEIKETMVTKSEFSELKDETLRGQDEMIGILRRLDQERVFVTERTNRIEEDVKQLKVKVGLA